MINVQFQTVGQETRIVVQAEKYTVELFNEMIGGIVGYIANLGLGVDFHIHLDLKNNIKSLIENDKKPYELLTDGFLLEAKLNINKGLSHKLRANLLKKFAKSCETKGYIPSRI